MWERPLQVADDRGDARAPPPRRGQKRASRIGSAHLESDLPGQRHDFGVQEEEAREAEPRDHRELLGEPLLCLTLVGRVRVALTEHRVAHRRQLAMGLGVLGSRVAVVELAGQVEAEAIGQAQRLRHRLRMAEEALGHLLRGLHRGAVVAAQLRLCLIEALAQPHRDHRVLQIGATGAV